jgi:catechol 2,3-dioxygenase-like lactoylglutathione lyase family enzyme
MIVYGIDHIQLAIPPGREAEARYFYGSLLGLTEVPKPRALIARGGVWFQCGSIQLHLGVDADFRPAKKAHPAFLITQLSVVVGSLRLSGCKIQDDQNAIDGYDRAFTEDPFGNRIELIQRREDQGTSKVNSPPM